ncbi:MAG TPA: hypothetical protein VNQ76_13950 [Planctomicrobium sp.]|nr:hypothetical protein [Planctomicrobium sp.]
MLQIDHQLRPADLLSSIGRMWEVSAHCLNELERNWTPDKGSPVFTIEGKYTSQGWTEWTQGFQFGSAILQFDATRDERFLQQGRSQTLSLMAPHVSHIGVHDHGFNNVSTYGALRRLVLEKRFVATSEELALYELALKASGAVQAARWSRTQDGGGYIYSFNGPHSLFADTIRSLRSLALAHRLGHRLMGENDEAISLLSRLIQHARTTADFIVYYGEARDTWDTPGRVVHESIFNTNDGRYRCPSTQQGYSPFTTWTRGAAWIVTGYAEQLEFLATLPDEELEPFGGRTEVERWMRRAAIVSAQAFINDSPTDGVPYWDTGAPGLVHLKDWDKRPSDPWNDYEPVDSSAAAIASQGLIRLGQILSDEEGAETFLQAGLTMFRSLLNEPYLNGNPAHQGLLLHSVYHRPRNWDYIPPGRKIPCGEACLWGDYHLRETALLVQRLALGEPYYTFFGP